MSTTVAINATADENGDIIRYACEGLNNTSLHEVYAPFAYELRYDCSSTSVSSESDGMDVIAESMLVKLRNQLLMLNETHSQCAVDEEETSQQQQPWIGAVDSRPPDRQIPNKPCIHFDNLVENDDFCCIVVQGNVTLTTNWTLWIQNDNGNTNAVLSAARSALIASNGTSGYTVHYLGADLGVTLGTGSDNLGETLNTDIPEPNPVQTIKEDSEFTVLGAFVLVFMVLCILMVVSCVVYQRNKRLRRPQPAQIRAIAVVKPSEGEDGLEVNLEEGHETVGSGDPSKGPTTEPIGVIAVTEHDDSVADEISLPIPPPRPRRVTKSDSSREEQVQIESYYGSAADEAEGIEAFVPSNISGSF